MEYKGNIPTEPPRSGLEVDYLGGGRKCHDNHDIRQWCRRQLNRRVRRKAKQEIEGDMKNDL